MTHPGTIVFDIIGTCFSLDKPRQQLTALGAPAAALPLWFAQTLRDAFALSHAGGYQPLQQILSAELPRTLALLAVDATPAQLADVIDAFSELELQVDAVECFELLAQAGLKIVALTNSSENATRKLLERAECLKYFAEIHSADTVKKTKPHPDVYNLVSADIEGDTWLVAAHAWDIVGAARAGLKTAFITPTERGYLAAYPPPTLIGNSLNDVAIKIISTFTERHS